MFMAEVKKKPISSELRKLRPGGAVMFPVEQRGSVIAVISRLRKDLIRERWDCEVEDVPEKYEIRVVRKIC